ncbi:hypothetical protein Y032_0089g2300 [Ancylostoma ceylanicum]|uniref:Uncharacterized protein n=1 Tax=Ancylostoma ceylanicum TaxID=53326 RepID=A0A016TP31_9BILA|nr:hypothetical protein Y032_0089g2300 [Ancylostoma ceylanicum]
MHFHTLLRVSRRATRCYAVPSDGQSPRMETRPENTPAYHRIWTERGNFAGFSCQKIGKFQPNNAFNITGIVLAAQEEAHTQKETKTGDKVNLPTNDLTMMHEAIPFLPVPVALLCLFLNVVIPGTGLCLRYDTFRDIRTVHGPATGESEGGTEACHVVNLLVGVSQFFTITFLFVGWFWSIAWGGLLIIHSMQYREALQQRRQEAVATAAIEALTKDSILHRRDVKTLVKTHKQQAKDKKTAAS